jgi:hypothetical protein
VHTAGKLFVWEERNSGRYEHVRACRERARAARAKQSTSLNHYFFLFNLMKRKIPLLRPILSASEPEGITCTVVLPSLSQLAAQPIELQGRASGKTALGAPWHGQGSTSSMPGPTAMQLPTIVYHL